MCRQRGEWTRTSEPIDDDNHYKFYPPEGWHSAGSAPGFCSQSCADGWALLERETAEFRDRRRGEILKDNVKNHQHHDDE